MLDGAGVERERQRRWRARRGGSHDVRYDKYVGPSKRFSDFDYVLATHACIS